MIRAVTMINDWFESQHQETVNVWCEDPETNTEKVAANLIEKSYVTYRIRSYRNGREVVGLRTRYSMFESVRISLKNRYHPIGILVPPLPAKYSKATTLTKQVDLLPIKERTLGLTLFLQNAAANAFLRNDSEYKALIRNTNEVYTPETENQGYNQALNCLDQLEIPAQYPFPQTLESIRAELKVIDTQASSLLDKARALESAEKSLQAATEGMRKGLESWADGEKQSVRLFQGKIFDEQGPVVKSHESSQASLEALFTAFAAKKNIEEDSSSYTTLTITALLEFEVATVETFREMLKWHDDTLRDIEIHKNKCKTYEKYEKQVNEWRELIARKEKSIQHFYKGLIYFTIPFIARQRATNFRRFFSSRMSALQSTSYHVFKAAEAYFNQVILNTELVGEEATKMFEILKIKPILRIPHDELEVLTGRKNRSSLTLKSGISPEHMFLAHDTTGLINLFDRALAITQKKPLEGGSTMRGGRETDEYQAPPPPPPPLPPMPPALDTYPKDQEVWGEEGEEAQFT